MRQIWFGLGVSAVFFAGCVAGASRFAVPKARAEGEAQRFAYFCFDAETTDDLNQKANAAGAEGWQMVSGAGKTGSGGSSLWCFKRPR